MSHRTNTILALVFIGLTIVTAFALLYTVTHAAILQWDRNTEADLKEYEVYVCTPAPTCTITPSVVNRIGVVPQPAIGVVPSFTIPAGSEGKAAVSASDFSGNESELSVPVPFDAKAPVVPLNLRLAP